VPSLMRAVSNAGLESDLLMPGMIPYADLMPLMQASTALLNPSLFEGWSTTVEEARAAGVPMVLSDLDVHREQAGDHATYFDRYSAESLADALANFKPPPLAVRLLLREQARAESERRVKQFAHEFIALAHAAVKRTN
jgi:glycosyltransferase involved in cell wall biosynthesis